MAYITTGVDQPGIVELLFYKGSTGKALSKLAQTLLRGPSGLTVPEREMIAARVSALNDCQFCEGSHSAAVNSLLQDDGATMACMVSAPETAAISDKMKALLDIAARVQVSGREVQETHIEAARLAGATDEDIHDAVLIASAFCMFNRYVDGLGTRLPDENESFTEIGDRLAKKGYKYPPLFLRKFVIRMINRKRARNS